MSERKWTPGRRWLLVGLVFSLSAVFAVLFPPKRSKPPRVWNVDEAAAEVTEAAGRNFTRGAIEAVKEALHDD